MVEVEHTESMMILLAFLILLLIVVVLLMLVTLIMTIIMIYMTLISLKELQKKTGPSNPHSTEYICGHCSSNIIPPTVSSTTHTTSPLQTEATTEAFQQPKVNIHNNSTLPSSIDIGELNENVDKKDVSYIESSSALHYIHSNLYENENDVFNLIQSKDTEKGVNDVTLIVKSNNSSPNEQIKVYKENSRISSLHVTSDAFSKISSFDDSEKQYVKPLTDHEQVNIMKITDSQSENILQPNIKLSKGFENIETENIKENYTSLEEDSDNNDNSLMESKPDLDIQGNGSIESRINESMQNSENVIYLNSYDSNIVNESSAIEVNQTSEKLDKKSFETASLNASQTVLYNSSSEKVIITSVSSESLLDETSKNIEAEENALNIPETKSTNIPNNDLVVNTDQNTVQADVSSKSSQESPFEKSLELNQELSSNKVIKTTSMDDFDTLNRVSPSENRSVTDIINIDVSKDNTSNSTSVPNESDISTSPEKIEHSSSTVESSEDTLFTLFKEADEMYQNMDYDNLYVLLKKSKIDQENAEFLWRLGRATWQRAMKENNETEQLSLHKEALDYVHSALALNESNGSVHRWISIITDYVARTKDVRSRVSQSAVCRDHMFRAVELNPNDGVSWYLLGFWHYCAADLPWYQRQLAKALFSTEFNGTYEQALDYFLKGHKTNKEFYSTNVYMIGRCYQKMGRRDQAITWIRLARDYTPIRTWNDKETHEEATEKLKKLEAK